MGVMKRKGTLVQKEEDVRNLIPSILAGCSIGAVTTGCLLQMPWWQIATSLAGGFVISLPVIWLVLVRGRK